MKTSDAFLNLSKKIQDSQFVINASLTSDSNELLKFDLELFSNENGYISLKFHVFINQTILAEKVIQNGGVVIPKTDIDDIQEFIVRRNIELGKSCRETIWILKNPKLTIVLTNS